MISYKDFKRSKKLKNGIEIFYNSIKRNDTIQDISLLNTGIQTTTTTAC